VLQLVWFKRDLRVHDHEPLAEAARRGPVLPLYIVEPDLWQQADMAGRHWAFVRECLDDLRARLSGLGQPLVVRQGDAVTVLGELLRRYPVAAVWSHQETGNAWTFARDRAVAELLREHGLAWHERRQHGVVRGRVDRDRWSRQWEALMQAQPERPPALQPLAGIDAGPIPAWPAPGLAPDPCPGRQAGGRISACQALDSFLAVRGERYHREMSSPLSAAGSCSRLSAHVAAGSLGLREVVQATRARRAGIAGLPGALRGGWGRALAAFEGRLHWHCHFMQKLESEPRIEFENLHRALDGLRGTDPAQDRARLQAWRSGETGWPLVDACMRALAHGGWINFRMRALLVSVASYQLWLDWRQPGLHLARLFLDYEPGIHWPQVQMQSGTTGINTLRIYNPVKQSLDQDPKGLFIRTWLPELAALPDAWVHTPWRMPPAEQRRYGVRIGRDYPAPLVDHEAAARSARQRIQAARRDAGAREQSRAIYDRHGSRRRPARRPAPAAAAQPDLFDDGA
jgi:deoxyribodipyrimidine photo-lyase